MVIFLQSILHRVIVNARCACSRHKHTGVIWHLSTSCVVFRAHLADKLGVGARSRADTNGESTMHTVHNAGTFRVLAVP
jgi:hypothetical protein